MGLTLRAARAQRVARRAEPGPVLGAAVGRATPIERLVLRVTLAELIGDLGFHQLGAEIERVRAVGFDAELIEQGESVRGDEMARAAIDVNAVLGRLDAEII